MTEKDLQKCGKCPYVTAQRLLQGKWSIVILHNLDGHTLRFSELQKLMPYVTNATLSSQLKTLEQEGLVRRSVYPEVPPRVEYELTDIGREFEPVLSSIATWGEKYMDWKKKAS